MLKNVLIGSLLLVFSNQVFATNAVERMFEEKSGAAPYEILENFYSGVQTWPVNLQFLNQIDFTNYTRTTYYTNCVVSYEDNKENLENADLAIVYLNKFIPGVPSRGPLFPGTPDQNILQAGCSLAMDTELVPRDQVQRLLNESYLYRNTDGSVSCNTPNEFSSYTFKTSGLNIKTDGTLLSFRSVKRYRDIEGDKTVQGYGYCWNK